MGSQCSRAKGSNCMKKILVDEVFSWSPDDIFNEELFKEEVKKIPESFQDLEEYLISFLYPLLEETRAELCFSFENISRAPYAEVGSISSKQNGELLYEIKIDCWKNRFGGVNGEDQPYRILPGDIFVFTDAKPETISDWQGREWVCLGKLIKYDNGDDDNGTSFQVKASKEIEVKFLSGRPLFVVFLTNIRKTERNWDSLQMDGNLKVFEQILCSGTQVRRNSCSTPGNCSGVQRFNRALLSELNELQREVVDVVLHKVQCNRRSSLELIWGLPGTGKTRTLSILLYILLKMECRTLICAPTEVAIAELASRVLELLKESNALSLVSGIFYFGDNNVPSVNADIQEICLDQVGSEDNFLQIRSASLIFCTASSSYKLCSVLTEAPRLLIIDEAAQLKECESLIPLQLPGVRHTVLFGDHCQLMAKVTSNVSGRAAFGRSLFERLISIGHPKHILNMQYRMHPFISYLPNSEFYCNQILNAPSKCYAKCFLSGPMFGPYSFINVTCGIEEVDSLRYDLKNMVEVAIVIKMVRKLFKAWSGSNQKLSVGIASPYTAQVVAIKDKVGRKYDSLDGFSLKVNTIDGFQGGEEDVMILSTVRSNTDESVGSVFNRQRTNLALTRARSCFWIVGDGKALSNINSVWKLIVQDAKERQCFYNAEEDEELANVVLEVKKELDQFYDILNSDSMLFKNARWKVIFSDIFKQSFQKLKPLETKKLVINLLLRLSCGWRPKRRNTNIVFDNSFQMLKLFKVKHLRIICTIDIKKDLEYIQVLKIWDILPLEDIPKLAKRLNSVFESYTDGFINRCKFKFLEGDLEVPMSWSSDVARYKDTVQGGNDSRTSHSDETGCVEICKARDSLLLMKFYALSSSVVSHLLTGCDGNEMDFPFELTDEEMEVIHFRKSSFILGRSGTGKTTVLIMKLFQKEQLYHLASQGYHEVESSSTNNVSCGSGVEKKETFLRQIFVTVNVRLCYAVSEHISRLKRSTWGWKTSEGGSQSELDDIDEMSQFSEIPDSFADLSPCSYPLVITFNKFLMMLNGTVGRSFFERFPELRIFYKEKRKNSRSMALKTFIRTKEVRYDKFCSSYWQHFSQQLIKKLDPSTVFAEIISHIKGGLWAGDHDEKLSREDYISYSQRRLSHLTEQERSRIYDIFLEYEKKKKTYGEFDLSDLVLDLHQRLRNEIFDGEKMDFVYIDEVQDLTIRQISLFKYICRNFEEGFVFSGDTAQTIARGVDFRFQDIKALFYKEFGACERTRKGKITDLFHLRQNFRTHVGVLRLANSVLDLVFHFFPSSIDKLDPETSLLSGEKPVWVQMKNGQNALESFFKGSKNNNRGLVGFGAEQVILVRDESARNEVLSHVGKQALVLTVVECKGLEFQDVLLYNFFGSSLLKDQWEVIYGYTEKQNLLKFSAGKPFPIFNEGKHMALCSELKQLYVAITRTRQRLWIFENECCSMFNYWEKLCVVQVRELDYNFLQEIQVASSPKEWKARGMKFFYLQNYDKARFCFERAGEKYWEKLAMAVGHVYTADHIRSLDPRTASKHLTEAAHIYEFIGKNESAAQCYFESHEYEKAGIIYLGKCGESKLEEAGECFYLAGFYEKAAKIYAKCRSFSKCLSACDDGKLFRMGYQYIQVWKENNFQLPKSEEVQTFLERGALYFHKLRDSESMTILVKSFESKNQMRTFLKRIDRLDELISLEQECGNVLEAANIAEMKGDVLLQVDLLEMAGELKGASHVILFYVLYSSLWMRGSKGWPLKHFVEKDELLKKAKSFAKNASPDFYDFVCIEANILSDEKENLLKLNKCWNDSWRHGSVRSKILCARKILDAYLYPGTLENQRETLFVDLIKYTENRISWSYISVVTLVQRWSFWKDEIEKILSYVQDDSSGDSNGEFLMSYFGVIKQSKNKKTMYLLLCPDAAWIKDVNLHCIDRNEKSWIEASQLVYAAKSYWSSEILTVGMKVLELLEELYVFSVNKALSIYCKCMLLTQIFEVSKPLVEATLLSNNVQRVLRIPMENFFGLIYPLDWRVALTKDMIFLRETGTSRTLLKEVFHRIISSKPVTSAQIGELTMILLSRKFSPDLYVQIEARCGNRISWQVFIRNFRRTMNPHDPIQDTEEVSLVRNFHKALEDTDYTNFSPNCYLYLLDRLMFMVSYLKGYFFTAKTSLVEWLLCKGWNVFPNFNFVSDVKVQSLLEVIVKFVARSVHDILYVEFFSIEPAKWMKNYNLQRNFYPLVVLRLFVVLCQLCTNFEEHFSLLFNVLDKEQFTQFLPWEFYQSLRKLKEHDRRERKIGAVAEALKSIGNPLVTVNLGIHCAEYYFPDTIFLYLNVQQDKQNILDTLFA